MSIVATPLEIWSLGRSICLSPAQHFVLVTGMDCMNVVTVTAWYTQVPVT